MTVEIAVRMPPPPGHTYWLIAVRRGIGVPPHPVYYAKHQLDASPGRYNYAFHTGAERCSVRSFFIVAADANGSRALQENERHDPDPAWDVNRVQLPTGATLIVSNEYPAQITR